MTAISGNLAGLGQCEIQIVGGTIERVDWLGPEVPGGLYCSPGFVDYRSFWAQLASDDLSASIICNGFHLPPEQVRIVARVKGLDRTILVDTVLFNPPSRTRFAVVPRRAQ